MHMSTTENQLTNSEQKLLIYNNIEFVLLDLSEMCRSIKNEIAGRLKWGERKEVKRNAQTLSECKKTFNHLSKPYKSLLFALTDYKAIVRETEIENQIQFGEDADLLMELIITAIDRSGDDNDIFREIIEYIKKRPSKLGL